MNKKPLYLFAMLLTGIFIGNRVFNHVNAWIGIAIIVITVLFYFYKLFKFIKENEKTD